MSDLTNLIEWNQFAEDKKTVLEVLTILNNRHRTVIKARDKARKLYDHMRSTAEENGFESLTDAVTQEVKMRDLARELRDALQEDLEFFADREDADHDGQRFIGNDEMQRAQTIREILNKAKEVLG